MMNLPLFKQAIKSNWLLLVIFTAVPCVFLAVMIAVFTTDTLVAMQAMLNSGKLPANLTQMMGNRLDLNNLTLTGILAAQYFQMMAVIFPMIYCIIVGNKLIASQVDRGSMAYVLSAPIERNSVTVTQAMYLISSLVVMFGSIGLVGVAAGQILQPDQLDFRQFLMMDASDFLLAFAIGGITFCFSCIFNLSKHSIALGAGFPLAFFVITLLSQSDDSLKNLKYLSLITFSDTHLIIRNGNSLPNFIAMFAIGVALYAIGILVFRRKDLPL